MEVTVLASGSKGNSTLIKTKEYKILIDAGMSTKYLENKLRELEILLQDIDYIFLTHTHTDHTNALKTLIKKCKPTIIMTEKMFLDLPYLKDYDSIIILTDDINIGNLKIESIPTSHDTSDSRGYIITKEDFSVVVITDTGYINQKHFNKLKNKDIYIFESNHDVELLMNGSYPSWLKRRVFSDVGHLSNEAASYYLAKLIGPKTKKIILAHLSEENNTPEIALENINDYFAKNNIEFTNIVTAKQNEITKGIEV
ncbi:MAG: MBL fold metallo-hydrolase [Bacilli bacterium]|nr:MBL fold metallo-hydrolase [Bacilli bacterium]